MFSAATKSAHTSASGPANYIEDYFSTYLYTGNSTSGGTQTITNGLNVVDTGGLVWIKGRSAASTHILTDTSRGDGTSASNNYALATNLTAAENLGGTAYDYLDAFNTNGFTVKQGGSTTATRGTNYNGVTYASWTFLEKKKFFDIVTFTTDSSGDNYNIPHNLGSRPGFIIVKRTDATSDWYAGQRGTSTSGNFDYNLKLNTTGADLSSAIFQDVTSTNFMFIGSGDPSPSGSLASGTFIAYVFAHNAGGFGATGTDNVISCGSFTTDSNGGFSVNLGYEPQWVLVKGASTTGNWFLVDNMRGFAANGINGTCARMYANTTGAESSGGFAYPTATGFAAFNSLVASQTYIYIAIRRGPMKTPTTGTDVFSPVAASTTGLRNAGFPVDFAIAKRRATTSAWVDLTRLTYPYVLDNSSTAAETDYAGDVQTYLKIDNNSGVDEQGFWGSSSQIWEMFRRAPGFFDTVCYTGNGGSNTVYHNLGVTPELQIIKARNNAGAWWVLLSDPTKYMMLDATDAVDTYTFLSSRNSTSFSFSNTAAGTNNNAWTYVSYLFATVAGVSKVGSYTGTGTTKQVDCGFTGGARFVLIKRTDSAGDWYVWDSARGIVAGNDPYLLLNSTAAEVTNTDYVDTYSAGFEISSTAPAAINANGGSFIFLAIA